MRKDYILLNAISCRTCGDYLESKPTDQWHECKCGKIAVDGGHNLLRRVFRQEDRIREHSLMADLSMKELFDQEIATGVSPERLLHRYPHNIRQVESSPDKEDQRPTMEEALREPVLPYYQPMGLKRQERPLEDTFSPFREIAKGYFVPVEQVEHSRIPRMDFVQMVKERQERERAHREVEAANKRNMPIYGDWRNGFIQIVVDPSQVEITADGVAVYLTPQQFHNTRRFGF